MARRKRAFTGQVNDLDLRLMRVFKKVIECGGLSAAQTELGVGRSTISKQISDLETRLGVRLCHRGRSGFSLTQQGRQALDYMDQLLNAADDFRANVAGLNATLAGKIEIGMIDYTLSDRNNPLIPAIKACKEMAPDVAINLMTGTPAEVERGVIDGRLHLGIVPDYQRHAGLTYNYLYDEYVGLFAGGEHPLAQGLRKGKGYSPDKVEEHALVYRGYYESQRLRDLKQRFPVGSTVYQTEAVLALVQSGVYLGFFPVHCRENMGPDVVEILPDVYRYSSPICAIARANRQQSLILQNFMELLLQPETGSA